MTIEERKRLARLNAAWLAGEKIDALRFRYNSTIRATLSDGTTMTGWIVGASIDGSEPTYTIESQNGTGDVECTESSIQEIGE